MADKDFVVKNGIVVNTGFAANGTQFTLGTYGSATGGFLGNSSVIVVGNSTVNSSIGGSVLFFGNTSANSITNATAMQVSNSTNTATLTATGLTTGNTVLNTDGLYIGNSSVNVSVNTVSVALNSTVGGIPVGGVVVNTNQISFGNSAANVVLTKAGSIFATNADNITVLLRSNTAVATGNGPYVTLNRNSVGAAQAAEQGGIYWRSENSTVTYTGTKITATGGLYQDLKLFAQTSIRMTVNAGSREMFTITNTYNVGINNPTPTNTLSVGGSTYISDSLAVGGTTSTYDTITGVTNSGTGVQGISNTSSGVYGYSNSSIGINGQSNTYIGTYGQSNSGTGVMGIANSGTGAYFYSNSGTALSVQSNTGGTPFTVKLGTNGDSTGQPGGSWSSIIYNATNLTAYNGLLVKNNWRASTSTILEVGNDLLNGAYTSYFKVDGLGNVSISSIGSSAYTGAFKLNVTKTAGASIDGDVRGNDGTYWWGLNSRTAAGSYNPLVQTGDATYIFSNGTINGGGLVIGQWSDSNKGIRIDSAGNMGLGTASPLSATNYKFMTVQAGSAGGGYSIYNSSGVDQARMQIDSGALTIYNYSALPTRFANNTVEWMRINPDGNVGIGTTSPTNLLHVENTSTSADYIAARFVSSAAATGQSQTWAKFEKAGSYGGAIAGYLNQGVNSGLLLGTMNNSSTPTERMRITDGGNVGIGVTNPGYPLDISSGATTYPTAINVRASTHATSRRAAITLDNWSLLQDSNGDGVKNFAIYGGTAASTKLYITPDGNISIGTTATYGKLTIISPSLPTTIAGANQLMIGENTANPKYYLKTGYTCLNYIWSGVIDSIANDLASQLLLNPTGGNVGIGTTSPSYTLDVSNYTRVGKLLAGDITATTDTAGIRTNGDIYMDAIASTLGYNLYYDTTGPVWRYRQTGPGFAWRSDGVTPVMQLFAAASGSAGTVATVSAPVTFAANGNMGLGVSTPNVKLDVRGVSGSNAIYGKTLGAGTGVHGESVSGTGIYGYSTSGTGLGAYSYDGVGLEVRSNTYNIAAFSNSTNYGLITINNLGRVGIANSNPVVKLHISGVDDNNSEVFINSGTKGLRMCVNSIAAAIDAVDGSTGITSYQNLNIGGSVINLCYGSGSAPGTNFVIKAGTNGDGFFAGTAKISDQLLISSKVNITDNQINAGYGQNSDNQELALNYSGYSAGTTKYRNTNIYNGKGASIATFFGASNSLEVYGSISGYYASFNGDGKFYSGVNDYTQLHGGSIEICSSTSESFIDFKNSNADDYDARILCNGSNYFEIYTNKAKLLEFRSTEITFPIAYNDGERQIKWEFAGGADYAARNVYLWGKTSDRTFGLWDSGLGPNGGAARWTTDTSGNFTAAGNVTAYSDIKLKTDITTIDNALDKVSKMRGVMFTRKDTGTRGTGVIAQEIKEILPEVVVEGENLSVAYGNIVGVLIEAIKELKAEIEQLKGK